MARAKKKDTWGDAVGDADWASYLDPAPGDLRIVQAFLNTADQRQHSEELGSPEALADWLRRWRLISESTRLDDGEREAMLGLRRDLRKLVRVRRAGRVDREVMARLDRVAAGALLRVRFPGDGAVRFEPAGSGFEGALGRLVQIVAQARLEGRWSWLKLCPGEGCGRVFYDSSPNNTRKWCSMQRCGNRAKARAFRRRNPGYGALAV